MLFRAESVNLSTVFIPARSDTTSAPENFKSSSVPSLEIETEKVRRAPFNSSGAREAAIAEITLFFPFKRKSRVAEQVFGLVDKETVRSKSTN